LIRGDGGDAIKIQTDLCDEEQTRHLIPKALKIAGPISCLINNASLFEEDSAETASRESWDAHMQINLRSPFVLIQALRDQLPEGLEGNVINIVDQRVRNLTPHFLSYTLSKSGLWTLTQTLALSLAPHIRVNAIGPGPVLANSRQTEEAFIKQWSSLPLGRRVATHEIVDAIRFIIDVPSITGQLIALDGGQHLGYSQAPSSGGINE
jgi:NAD(P)-dependent dehydrogenase (short-subunit alcohol dehydrogenase family)